MTVGPVQLLAFSFEDYEPRGEILQELMTQVDDGVIRLIDAQVVRKDASGRTYAISLSGLSEVEAMEFGAVIGGLLGQVKEAVIEDSSQLQATLSLVGGSIGLGSGEIQDVVESLPPGGGAAILVIEHTWATGFSRAVRNAGGRMLAQGFLTREALLMVGEELKSQAEAAEAIQTANKAKLEAAREAARAMALADFVKTKAAKQAAAALVDARLVEQRAIEEAAEVLASVFALKTAAEDEAMEAIARADQMAVSAAHDAELAMVEAEATIAQADQLAEEAVEQAMERRKKRPTLTAHELTYIEGIGPANAELLKKAGITSTIELLEKGATPGKRDAIARETGLSKKLLLRWINHADLFRIRGIGSEYADLLEAAGVDTVVELSTRNAVNLHKTLEQVNEEKQLVRQIPSQNQVQEWIEKAKALPRVISY